MTEPSAGAPAEVPCPLCGSTASRVCFREPPFAVRACAACDLRYTSPRVPDAALAAVYDADYWRSPAARERGYTDYARDTPLLAATFRRRMRVLEPHFARAGRVLDVGCASGVFLELMRSAGWSVHGLEPSAAIRTEAERRLGAEHVDARGVDEFEPGEARFELITLWDVLEHLPDPVGALRRARGWLAPGGRIVLETQDVKSLAARLLGRRWHHYKHAEHLVHFDRRTLARALGAAGLAPLSIARRHAGKVVRLDFVVERSARLAPALARVLAPLLRLGNPAFYVNPADELVAVAEAA